MNENRFNLINVYEFPQKIKPVSVSDFSTDRKFSILTETGVYIFELCGWTWPCNITTDLMLKKLFCTISDYSISANVGIDINTFINQLSQEHVYESVLWIDISSNLKGAVPVPNQPIKASWSSSGSQGCIPSALAVLSNVGVLEIFCKHRDVFVIESYKNVSNVTKCFLDIVSKNWKNTRHLGPEDKFKELCKRVSQIKPTMFVWGEMEKINDTYWSPFIVAHLNGGISFWKLQHSDFNSDTKPTLEFCYTFDSQLSNISMMHSFSFNCSGGLLLFGNRDGQIAALSVTDLGGTPKFSETLLYSSCDLVSVEFIELVNIGDYKILIITKSTNVIFALINEYSQMVDQVIYKIENIKITGLKHYEDNTIIVSTITGMVQMLQLTIAKSKLNLSVTNMVIKYNWKKYGNLGCIISPNRVFIGFLVYPCLDNKSKKIGRSKLAIFEDKSHKPLTVLMRNNFKFLTNYWDCLDILRIHYLKKKVYPCKNYPFIKNLNFDELPLIQLKVLLQLSRITEIIAKRKKYETKRNIERPEFYQRIIQIKMAIQRIGFLLQLQKTGKQLSTFQYNSLELAVHHLRNTLCSGVLETSRLGERTLEEIYQLMCTAGNLEYPPMARCFWCNDVLTGLNCEPPHYDIRCHISFMQITTEPGFKCQFCSSVVHGAISDEITHVLCPYCDIPMDLINYNDETRQNPTIPDRHFFEECRSDCLKEDENFREIPSEATEWEFDPDLVTKCHPNWEEINVSDVSGDESDEDVERIFDKELGSLSAKC